MNTFPLTIVTPDGRLFDAPVESFLVRTENGDVQILAGHADFVGAIGTGRAVLRTASGTRHAAMSGGFLSVQGGAVTAVAMTCEFREDIDVARAERSRAQAEERLRTARDTQQIAAAKAKLARALARLSVANM